MTLAVGLQFREQLPPYVADEFDQLIAALQTQFDANLPGPIRSTDGGLVTLTLTLQNAEQLPPFVREEFEQVEAALQTAFNAQRVTWIKSLQPFTVTIAAGLTSGTMVLGTAVDHTNRVVEQAGWTTNGTFGNVGDFSSYVTLTDGSTVTASRVGGGSTSATVIWSGWIKEYYPGIYKSIQRGTIDIASGSAVSPPLALTTLVDTSKAHVVNLGAVTPSDDTNAGVAPTRLSLDPMHVTATRAGSPARAVTTSFEVREYL